MRNLTHYEISILIKNEVSLMEKMALNNNFHINSIEARALDILQYVEEYKKVPQMED